MKKILKRVSILMAAVMIASAFGGCGKDDTDKKSSESSQSSQISSDSAEKITKISLKDTYWQIPETGEVIIFRKDGSAQWSNQMGGEKQDGSYEWSDTEGTLTIEDWSLDLKWDGNLLHASNDARHEKLKKLDKLPEGFAPESSHTGGSAEEDEKTIDLADTYWQIPESGEIVIFRADGSAQWSNEMGGEKQKGSYEWDGSKGTLTIEDWSLNISWDGLTLDAGNGYRQDGFRQLEKLPDGFKTNSSSAGHSDKTDKNQIDLADTYWQIPESGEVVIFRADGSAQWSNEMGGEKQKGSYEWDGSKGTLTIEDWSLNISWDGLTLDAGNGYRQDGFRQLEKLPDGFH